MQGKGNGSMSNLWTHGTGAVKHWDETWLAQQLQKPDYHIVGEEPKRIQALAVDTQPQPQRRADGVLRITFPNMRLVSEANRASHEHWRKRQQRAKDQRYTVYYTLRCTYWEVPALPVTVTLTRIAPRELDQSSLIDLSVAIREAIADWLVGAEGQGNPEQAGVVWSYRQRQGKPREYALGIMIEAQK
jgi:hypothetical protein